MFARRPIFIVVVAAFSAAVGVVLCSMPASFLRQAELQMRDFVARHGRRTPPNPKLIFLAIDSESIRLEAEADLKNLFDLHSATPTESQALELMSRHWPWPRTVHGMILDRLLGAGAKAVAFDLLFATPFEGDPDLRAALDRHAGQVVIGSNFTLGGGDGTDERMTASLTLPSQTIIPSPASDDRIGFVNFWPDADGIIRQSRFRMDFGQFMAGASIEGERAYSSLAAQVVKKSGEPSHIPADAEHHAIRYTAPPGEGFRPHSIFEIFVPEYWERNYQSGKLFDGAIVIIGAAGNWQHDEHQTPMGVMAGPEIQLNVVNALLHGEFLSTVSWPVSTLIWLLAAGGAALVCIYSKPPLIHLGFLAAGAAGWAGLQFPLYNWAGVFAPTVGPLSVLGVTGLCTLVYDLIAAAAEELRLRLHLAERKRQQELLTRTNEELERRVAERTAELTQANGTLQRMVEEKDVLLKEIHHRVKNNLQVISSLLNLQSGYIEDPAALRVFTESRYRVRSMALIHEKLYQSQDLSRIDFADYISALTSGLRASYGSMASRVQISVDVEEIMLGVDSAVPCGLIVNELVTNSFKYAFKPGDAGEVRIGMKRLEETRFQLKVSDNGRGFPKEVDFRATESLGMQLVTTLTEQLDGTISLRNGVGTTFEIEFTDVNRSKE